MRAHLPLAPITAVADAPPFDQVRDVFAHVADTPQRAFTVLFSYLEIYNEQLKDLLNPSAKLDVVEGLAGVDVRGCKPVEVTDVNEVRGSSLIALLATHSTPR
jgi:hypothetical protein